jgi:hypothetical protein
MSAALLGGRPVVVTPQLVRIASGSVTRAAVLQQIHWHRNEAKNDPAVLEHDGQWWVAITYVDLGGELGLSAEQVRRSIEWLERPRDKDGNALMPLLLSVQPENYYRRKWYRLNEDHPELSDSSNRRNRQMHEAKTPTRSGGSAVTPLSDAERRGRAKNYSKQELQRPVLADEIPPCPLGLCDGRGRLVTDDGLDGGECPHRQRRVAV